MVRTAICDDDADFIVKIRKSLEHIINETETDMIVESYSDSLDFFQEYMKNPYDIVFLDIEMSGLCGFQIVEKLRLVNDNVIVIFISSHDSYVFRSLAFRPFRFIRKSRYEEELYEAFVGALQVLERKSRILSVASGGETVPVNLSDILYFDVYSHSVFLHTNSDKMPVRRSLQELEDELKSVGFIRIHKSYLVNSRHIYFVKSASVVLDDHSTLPVSKHRIKDVRDKMIKYVKRAESLV